MADLEISKGGWLLVYATRTTNVVVNLEILLQLKPKMVPELF